MTRRDGPTWLLVSTLLSVTFAGCAAASAYDGSTGWKDSGLYERLADAPLGYRHGVDRAEARLPAPALPAAEGFDDPSLILITSGEFEIGVFQIGKTQEDRILIRHPYAPDPRTSEGLAEQEQFNSFVSDVLDEKPDEVALLWAGYVASFDDTEGPYGPGFVEIQRPHFNLSSISNPCDERRLASIHNPYRISQSSPEAIIVAKSMACVQGDITLWYALPVRWLEKIEGGSRYTLRVGPNDHATFGHSGPRNLDDAQMRAKLAAILKDLGREPPSNVTFSHTYGD
jgi:hypothetical protein